MGGSGSAGSPPVPERRRRQTDAGISYPPAADRVGRGLRRASREAQISAESRVSRWALQISLRCQQAVLSNLVCSRMPGDSQIRLIFGRPRREKPNAPLVAGQHASMGQDCFDDDSV